MNSELSVIVPVYNVEPYVAMCIESLKAQTLENFEVIIVDDGSQDNSISICEELIAGDDRFKIIHKENGGLMSAWKEGVRNAKGTYIGFVDSDDWVDADMFSVLLRDIKKYEADILCSGHIAENPNEQIIATRDKLYIFEGKDIREKFVKDYCCSYFSSISNPTVCRWDKIYKKEIVLNNMEFFNEKVSLAEDFNANIAMILNSNKIVLIPDFTPYHYRFNPKSIVNTVNPKAFKNIKHLSEACGAICKNYNSDDFYINSFIGNILFEEVKRICRGKVNADIRKELNKNLSYCNADYYLTAYSKCRNNKITSLSCLLIKMKCFLVLHLLLVIKVHI